MRLRDRRAFNKPEVMIIPMIDIMFFLLVFFIMSTLYMVNLKTVDVNLPKAQTAQTQLNVTYLVTVRKDGTLWLEDKQIDEATLLRRAHTESQKNPKFAVVVRSVLRQTNENDNKAAASAFCADAAAILYLTPKM